MENIFLTLKGFPFLIRIPIRTTKMYGGINHEENNRRYHTFDTGANCHAYDSICS